MKKMILVAVLLGLASPPTAFAAKDARPGPCIKDCMQAFNPAQHDSGGDDFLISGFQQEDCLEWCKGVPAYDACGFWTDGCCYV